MVDYTITSFGDMVSSVVADPKGGMNMVAMSTKPVSSPDWAGVTASTPFGFKDDIPFTATETKMSVRLYSPRCKHQSSFEGRRSKCWKQVL